MQIGPLTTTDWPLFKSWAAEEGWQTSFQEERLFLNFWQRYFYTLHHRGDCCGFISAIAYRDSGWIGNLLVNPQKRLQGYGQTLLEYALTFFREAGIGHIFILSKNQLIDFYHKFNFSEYDQVQTWTTTGLGALTQQPTGDLDNFIELNTQCWGETQRPLHHLLEVNSIPLQEGPAMALLQTGPNYWQLGPGITAAIDVNSIRKLLSQARDKTPVGRSLLVHTLHGNDFDLIFKNSGFSSTQSRPLLYLGKQPPALDNVLTLASNGSFG